MQRRFISLTQAVIIPFLLMQAAPGYSQTATSIQITRSAPQGLPASSVGGDTVGSPEIDAALMGDDHDTDLGGDADKVGGAVVNRVIASGRGSGMNASSRRRAKSNPEVRLSLTGLNMHDQRFANGGNQFSVEPPDQGLCAGNGFVLESVNDVLRIFNSAGVALTGPIDLNTFYGYAPAIDRAATPATFGPSITDPSCYFDAQTHRWFHLVLTLDRASPTTQALSGTNHLDIAVSTSADPTKSWVVYHVPVQNDGTQGTPDHNCQARSGTQLVHGPCLGDYPHIGADAHGIYVTTNEFNLNAPGFRGSQIYAFSKRALAANAQTIAVQLFDTTDPALTLDGSPGFTVWPAVSPAAHDNHDDGDDDGDDDGRGREFLLSSVAVFSDTNTDNRLRVWSLTNTQSLNTRTPALVLESRVVTVIPYSVPGTSFQKPGQVPLLTCVADPACAPLIGSAVNTSNVETRLPSNDSRMQQVVYANGKLWGALDTGLSIDGNPQNGIAFFVINPHSLDVVQQGYVGLANNNVNYPGLAVTAEGRGVMGFTLVGADHFPSAAYVSIDAKVGAGDIHVVAEGAGPQDGFTGYVPLGGTPARPRWGDYGAAVADGADIWLASEFIDQTCTYAEFLAQPLGQCGGTRAALGNWATRISKLFVGP
jgi:hypothetical protein